MEEERKRKREEVAPTEDAQRSSGAPRVTPEKKRRQKGESQEETREEETPEQQEEAVASEEEEDEDVSEEVKEHGEAHKEGTYEENQEQDQDDDQDADQQVEYGDEDEDEEVEEEEDEERDATVNGETVFNFGKHTSETFRHVLETDVSYANWARHVEDPGYQLRSFVDWTHSSEAKELFGKAIGSERFTFGQHAGMTFREIARTDPTYHVRYKAIQSGPPVLDRYIEWFNEYSGICPSVVQWYRLQDMGKYGSSFSYGYDEEDDFF
jgi:hypothetical protein